MASQYGNRCDNLNHLAETLDQLPSKVRRPGRSRVITREMEPIILQLHKKGYGYRTISKILSQYGISVHWSTIQRFIKNHNRLQSPPIQICVSSQRMGSGKLSEI